MEQIIKYVFQMSPELIIIVMLVIWIMSICIKWLFLYTAVEAGTTRAIENILKEYTDLIEDVPPDCPPPLRNDFQKNLND